MIAKSTTHIYKKATRKKWGGVKTEPNSQDCPPSPQKKTPKIVVKNTIHSGETKNCGKKHNSFKREQHHHMGNIVGEVKNTEKKPPPLLRFTYGSKPLHTRTHIYIYIALNSIHKQQLVRPKG